MELATETRGLVGVPVDARIRRGWLPEIHARRLEAPAARPRPTSEAGPGTAPDLERVWDRHGGSVYSLACALLGDEAAAVRVVTLAMVDLALSTDGESHEDTLDFLSRRVYLHSQDVSVAPSSSPHLPPVMGWLGQLAHLQRACLALCVFGGLTHREAADLLDVPPSTVAELLTAGLRELRHLAAGGTLTSA
jgi:hypothetical protein